jgi:hypothetical protein
MALLNRETIGSAVKWKRVGGRRCRKCAGTRGFRTGLVERQSRLAEIARDLAAPTSCVNRDVAAGELSEIAQPIFEFWPVQCTLYTNVPQAPALIHNQGRDCRTLRACLHGGHSLTGVCSRRHGAVTPSADEEHTPRRRRPRLNGSAGEPKGSWHDDQVVPA